MPYNQTWLVLGNMLILPETNQNMQQFLFLRSDACMHETTLHKYYPPGNQSHLSTSMHGLLPYRLTQSSMVYFTIRYIWSAKITRKWKVSDWGSVQDPWYLVRQSQLEKPTQSARSSGLIFRCPWPVRMLFWQLRNGPGLGKASRIISFWYSVWKIVIDHPLSTAPWIHFRIRKMGIGTFYQGKSRTSSREAENPR